MPKFTLISFKLCPYVQRSTITLEEKAIPYDIEYVDLANKPAWFLQLSPLGKVPVLRADDTVLFESAVINEYLDEITGPERLLPVDPLPRARDRAWIEFISVAMLDHWRFYTAQTEQDALAQRDLLRGKLQRLEAELGTDGSPLWHGEWFSLVDAAAAPMLQRIHWTDGMAPEHGSAVDLPRVTAWTEALLARSAVHRSTVPEIEDLFHAYVRAPRGASHEPGWLARITA